MGHNQRAADLNLGLGWLYYGLARVIRPARAVVIGSWRGFVPLIVGRALQDNLEGGEVTFIDPSLVDDFWQDAGAVSRYFARLSVRNIRHHLQERIAITRQLGLPHSADLPHLIQCARLAVEDFQQGAVVENHVGRHALFAGELQAFGLERLP